MRFAGRILLLAQSPLISPPLIACGLTNRQYKRLEHRAPRRPIGRF